MLLRSPDGGLSISDLGSANGTQLNGVDLVPGVAAPLKDGDSIGLGAWTRIVVHAIE
jgi:pSer/pThr/pTyr-binding forkhead associated (FHA) protein